jgi:hypothetical protein
VSTHRSHTGVKLGAKQLNIFRIGWQTIIFLDSIVNLKKNHYRTFYLKNDSDSNKN